MKKTVGYIVTGPFGPMRADMCGVLWLGNPVTLFATRRAANRAISATEAFRDRNGYTHEAWKTENHWICRVAAEAPHAH